MAKIDEELMGEKEKRVLERSGLQAWQVMHWANLCIEVAAID